MADQLRPYICGEEGAFVEEETADEGTSDDIPLMTISDINDDMLEVIIFHAGGVFTTAYDIFVGVVVGG